MQTLTKEKCIRLIEDAKSWEKGITDTFFHSGYSITIRKQEHPLFLFSAEAISATDKRMKNCNSMNAILVWIMNGFQNEGDFSTIEDVLRGFKDTSAMTDAEKIVDLIVTQYEAENAFYKSYKIENPDDKEREKIHSSIVGEYIKLLHSIRAMGVKVEV